MCKSRKSQTSLQAAGALQRCRSGLVASLDPCKGATPSRSPREGFGLLFIQPHVEGETCVSSLTFVTSWVLQCLPSECQNVPFTLGGLAASGHVLGFPRLVWDNENVATRRWRLPSARGDAERAVV